MLGLMLAASCIVTLLRVMPLRSVLGYATPVDLGFTGLLVWAFHGTLAGMTGAASGGLILATLLSAGRWLFGYRRPALRRRGLFRWRVDHVEVPSALGGWWRGLWNKLKGWGKQQAAAARHRMKT